mgnify:CR=1 FL=1
MALRRKRVKLQNLRKFNNQIVLLNRLLMRYNIEGFVDLLSKPLRLVYLNFIAGMARGFGIAIGLSLISALFLSILARLASLNLPLISNFIARIVRLVNDELTPPRY